MGIVAILEKVLSWFTRRRDRTADRILLAVDHLQPRPTSLEIRRRLEATGGVDLGWFYHTLAHLEEAGDILGDKGMGGPERDRLPVYMYMLTEQGKAKVKALKESEEQ